MATEDSNKVITLASLTNHYEDLKRILDARGLPHNLRTLDHESLGLYSEANDVSEIDLSELAPKTQYVIPCNELTVKYKGDVIAQITGVQNATGYLIIDEAVGEYLFIVGPFVVKAVVDDTGTMTQHISTNYITEFDLNWYLEAFAQVFSDRATDTDINDLFPELRVPA